MSFERMKNTPSKIVQNCLGKGEKTKTIYLHFRDKEDLLMSDWEKACGFFVKQFKWENIESGQFIPISKNHTNHQL